MTIYYRGEPWVDIIPVLPDSTEIDWGVCEKIFSNTGPPGFSFIERNMSNIAIFGHNEPVHANWLIYRDNDGVMAGMVIFFKVKTLIEDKEYEENTQAIFMVRPEYRKSGIGSKIIDYALEFWGNDHDYDFRKQKYSRAGADCVNKYVKIKYGGKTKMSAWKEYKEKIGTTRPWDILNPNAIVDSEQKSIDRYAICEQCPSFLKLTKQCKECGCFMALKVKLKDAVCPLGKW